ncbi:hypothetical protein DdX_06420 [Ditylenchus destructor]|uniref:Uncharacterized protein n=1 Tax=Ditylenchus destructor TaxID=166010 RepID=A0AAD4R8X7_9BILA|nr:hypothetical protein DdX_06420 [Ditylenchus destructor]
MPPPDTSETFEDEPTSSTVMAITVQEPVPKLFNAERFSSWNTLVRTAMTAMRFLKHRVNIDANSALMQKRKWLSITSEGPFTAEDYKLATLILLQLHQQEKSISDHETANLKFFKDEDGLIRLRSRMGNADWTEDSIHPILLWKDTHLETLSQTQKDPYFTEHEIYWKFIPELAPWFGSTYERLVAIAKDAFRKTVGKNVLTFDELQTFVSEVEASMNHRPLTYVTTDADGILPLRPIDFIQPNK